MNVQPHDLVAGYFTVIVIIKPKCREFALPQPSKYKPWLELHLKKHKYNDPNVSLWYLPLFFNFPVF